MGKRRTDADRYLVERSGTFQYHRKVPAIVGDLDPRAPKIRISLKTDDRSLARMKRDEWERQHDDEWRELLGGADPQSVTARHKAALRRVEALGFAYRSISSLVSNGTSMDEILKRISLAGKQAPESDVVTAVLGLVDEPQVTVNQAFQVYLKEIMPAELVGKSETQKADWQKVKARAVANFVKVVGDIPISEITREQALKFRQFWLGRVAPEKGRPTHSASSGNRDVGNMRQLFRMYHAHIGQGDKLNPFDGIAFAEKNKQQRPPFPVEWVQNQFLGSSKLIGLNREARGIILMMAETGARPSELANLSASTIHLSAKVPHIEIAPRQDPEDPREIKTTSSVRLVPLVGVALEVAKAFPTGFARYWNKERTLSNTLSKALDAHGLLPPPISGKKPYSSYSMRHTFEDRMKESKVDEELRKGLMGHVIDRPKYGDGHSLKMKHEAMAAMVLPFDPQLVHAAQVRKKPGS
jgi:integrase